MKAAALKPIRQRQQGQLVRFIPYLVGGVIFIIVPLLLPSYYQGIMAKVLIFAIFAMSLDLLYGYTALFSLGHAAYFGTGAYTVGLLMLHGGIDSFWITAPSGILMATLAAAILGFIAVRFRDIYFLVITFALGMLMYTIAWNVKWLKSPAIEGIVDIPRPDLGIAGFTWTPVSFYFFVFIVFVICYFLLRRIINSPLGLALQGIRESEPRMRVVGYNTWLYKYIAFVIAGLFAGIAGVLFAYDRGFVAAECLGIDYSFLAMLMVIIGGAGTLFGPIIGAALIVLAELLISLSIPERWPLILGALFVITIMLFRGGVAPHILRYWKKVSYRYESFKD